MKKIIIGARGSKLSLAYVAKVKSLILESSQNIDIHIKTIKTSGDIHKNIKLSEIYNLVNILEKMCEQNISNVHRISSRLCSYMDIKINDIYHIGDGCFIMYLLNLTSLLYNKI